MRPLAAAALLIAAPMFAVLAAPAAFAADTSRANTATHAAEFDPSTMSADFNLLAGQRRFGAGPVMQVDPNMIKVEYGLRLIVTESYSGKIVDNIEGPPFNNTVEAGSGLGAFFGVKVGPLSGGLMYDKTTGSIKPPSGASSDLNFNTALLYGTMTLPLSGNVTSNTGMAWEMHLSLHLPVTGELVDEDGDGVEGISGFGFEVGITNFVPLGLGAGTTGAGFYFQAVVTYRSFSYADSTGGGSVSDADIETTALTLTACLRM
jgi:hypothetical protein